MLTAAHRYGGISMIWGLYDILVQNIAIRHLSIGVQGGWAGALLEWVVVSDHRSRCNECRRHLNGSARPVSTVRRLTWWRHFHRAVDDCRRITQREYATWMTGVSRRNHSPRLASFRPVCFFTSLTARRFRYTCRPEADSSAVHSAPWAPWLDNAASTDNSHDPLDLEGRATAFAAAAWEQSRSHQLPLPLLYHAARHSSTYNTADTRCRNKNTGTVYILLLFFARRRQNLPCSVHGGTPPIARYRISLNSV